jgi:hypothetical protein
MDTVKAVWNRAVFSETIRGSWSSSSRTPGIGQQNVRRELFGGDHEIALVLPVLVVHDDDHLPGPDRPDGFFDRYQLAFCVHFFM